jgi:hypothetical protein
VKTRLVATAAIKPVTVHAPLPVHGTPGANGANVPARACATRPRWTLRIAETAAPRHVHAMGPAPGPRGAPAPPRAPARQEPQSRRPVVPAVPRPEPAALIANGPSGAPATLMGSAHQTPLSRRRYHVETAAAAAGRAPAPMSAIGTLGLNGANAPVLAFAPPTPWRMMLVAIVAIEVAPAVQSVSGIVGAIVMARDSVQPACLPSRGAETAAPSNDYAKTTAPGRTG